MVTKVKNSQGKIWYGLHFYEGVAEYNPPGASSFRVFINEDTARKMDKTFSGRPVYVEHVDDVPTSVEEMRKEADGFVVESFFNQYDGKHWCKFITCSEAADNAIAKGWKLSNCYNLISESSGGEWNCVSYQKQIMNAEYEHLAIVKTPRYQESMILTEEQFKSYNDKKKSEITRVANSKNKGATMFNWFKREKIENSAATDVESMVVQLPKSKREITIETLVNEVDEAELIKGKPRLVNGEDLFEVEGKKVTVASLLTQITELKNAAEEEKKKKKVVEEEESMENEDDEDSMENEDEEDEEKEDEEKDEKKKKKENKKCNSSDKRAADKAKADRLFNAPQDAKDKVVPVKPDLTGGVARGLDRYGSR